MNFRSVVLTAALVVLLGHAAHAEVDRLKVGFQYGLPYAQLIIMQDRDFLTFRARAAGVPDLKLEFVTLGHSCPHPRVRLDRVAPEPVTSSKRRWPGVEASSDCRLRST